MTSLSGRVHLQWATSRSLRLRDDPVDPRGVAPEVVIPKSEGDPVSYVKAWLERQVDCARRLPRQVNAGRRGYPRVALARRNGRTA
jgi:hypothetical protein